MQAYSTNLHISFDFLFYKNVYLRNSDILDPEKNVNHTLHKYSLISCILMGRNHDRNSNVVILLLIQFNIS